MALPRQPGSLVPLLLLVLWGVQGCRCTPAPLTPPAPCPEACVCPRSTLVNCSSAGLALAPPPPHPSVDRTTDLDLSHNLLRTVALYGSRPKVALRALRLGSNRLARLSLCLEERSSDGAGRRLRRNRRGRRCVSWAPGLLLLSAERNRLVEAPHGESPALTHDTPVVV